MVCPANNEANLTMVVVQPKDRNDGVFLVLVPNDLDAGEITDGLAEIGVDPQQVFEVSGWEKSSVGLAAAFLPFPKSR